MKTHFSFLSAVTLAFVAGCTGGAEPSSTSSALADVEVTKTTDGLHVLGYDAAHVQVAELTLVRGMVTLPEDQGRAMGRHIVVTVGRDTVESATEGFDQHVFPLLTGKPEINAFLTDKRVAPALLDEGIDFMAAPRRAAAAVAGAPSERTYSNNCSYGFSASCGSPTDCAPNSLFTTDGSSGCIPDGEGEDVCCPNSHQAVSRLCGNEAWQCPPVGPQGCGVCWSTSYSSCSASSSYNYCDCYSTDSDCVGGYSGTTFTVN